MGSGGEHSTADGDGRAYRIQQVLRNCIARRCRGEALSDAQVMSEHPDLMPELASALQKLALVRTAVLRGRAAVAGGSGGDSDRQPPQLPPDVFSGYEITGEIERGGQGIVYRAIQKATRREVAIKVMKEGVFAGQNDRARFEREVYTLGQLNHPNIVTIHDSGEAAGHFFYTMDYVHGRPLDEYMAAEPRGVKETLQLFVKICDAVNAAHLRGVIHRDLKPGNIRVCDDGEPRILDFGLAKVTVGQEDTPAMTVTGQFLGSLPWASPEQAEGIPAHIDVRTDVYALGMILYQMLTGHTPYPVTGSMRDVLENVLHAEPVRPGVWRRALDSDVETITLKCLSKERERRYQNAGELAADVRRYLCGEPIAARGDSSWYLLTKMVKRHRGPVAVAMGLVLLLAGGFVAMSMLYARAVTAENRERHRFEQVQTLANTLMFDLHDRIQNLAGATPVREYLVETGLAYLDGLAAEAGDDPVLQRQLALGYSRLGDVQGSPSYGGSLGDTEGALASYRKALAITSALAARDADDQHLREDTAVHLLKLSDVLNAMGRTEQALDNCRRALAINRELSESDRSNRLLRFQVSASLHSVGHILAALGRSEEALDCYHESIEIDRELLADDPRDARLQQHLAAGQESVGEVLWESGQTAAALERYREYLQITSQLSAADPDNVEALRDVFVGHIKIGALLAGSGAAEEALASFDRALTIAEALSAADPTNARARRDLSTCYDHMGNTLAALARLDEATEYYRRALRIDEDLSAADPANVTGRSNLAVSYEKMGNMLRSSGDGAGALEYYHRMEEVLAELLRADPTSLRLRRAALVGCHRIASLLESEGRVEEALARYDRARDLAEGACMENPDSRRLERDLALSYWHLAHAEGTLGGQADRESAERLEHLSASRKWYLRAREVLGEMSGRGLLDDQDGDLLQALDTDLSNCERAITDLEAGQGRPGGATTRPASSPASSPTTTP
jgi:tetratricopeptide (TPR) repeat protein